MKAARRILGLGLVVLTAGLRAGENPPAPPAPPGEDALAAVQRDYEAIQGTQSSRERQRLDLPAPSAQAPAAGDTAAMPGLNPPPSQVRPVARPGKSTNWLLDAMGENKSDPLSELRSGISADDGRRGIAASAAQDLAVSEPRLPAATKPGEAVDNPLAAYMSSWMTPHDLELLKDKGGADSPSSANQPPTGARGPAALGGAAPDLRANPYLVDLTPGLIEGSRDLTVPAPTNQTLLLPVPAGDLAPPKNQPQPGDQFKLQDDSKYFPQLKRF